MKKGPTDVPPGTGNPPKVKAALIKASKQIETIQQQLDALKETLENIRCEEY
jgi:hypothetical protein